MDDQSMFWDIHKTLSYDCLFNFIISARGGGKTYGCLKYCIEKYLKEKKQGHLWQFVYVRRHENELKKLTISRGGRLFSAVKEEFPEHELRAESNVLYCDNEICGYAIQLSTAHTMKSDPMPHVQMIVFDEFIIPRGSRYLVDEVTKFMELYETIARPGTGHPAVRVFLLGNAVTQSNPYFEYFYLDRPKQGEFRRFGKTKDILVQDVDVPALQLAKHASRFGQLIQGSEYAEYAIDNEWLQDNEEFIAKKTGDCRYQMSIKFNEVWYGVWFNYDTFIFYISYDVDMQHPLRFTVTTDDHEVNTYLIHVAKQMHTFQRLIEAYDMGAVRYESMKIKNNFREVFRQLHM